MKKCTHRITALAVALTLTAGITHASTGVIVPPPITQIDNVYQHSDLYYVHIVSEDDGTVSTNRYIYTPGMIFSEGLLEELAQFLGNNAGLLGNAAVSEQREAYWGGDFTVADWTLHDWTDARGIAEAFFPGMPDSLTVSQTDSVREWFTASTLNRKWSLLRAHCNWLQKARRFTTS